MLVMRMDEPRSSTCAPAALAPSLSSIAPAATAPTASTSRRFTPSSFGLAIDATPSAFWAAIIVVNPPRRGAALLHAAGVFASRTAARRSGDMEQIVRGARDPQL